jgi:phosphinothricin acetyltransferase
VISDRTDRTDPSDPSDRSPENRSPITDYCLMDIRSATTDDAPAIHAIYAPIVEATAISFELAPPSVDEMRQRIASTMERYPWLVATDGDALSGYAYATSFRVRPAYQWSVEVSAYVAETARGRGIGRALYEALLPELAKRGFVSAFAGIALPNDASIALHEACGFTKVGVFHRAGYKLGAWHDVGWWERALREPDAEPLAPW